jgi:uncharacterized protein (TIGR03435 family)
LSQRAYRPLKYGTAKAYCEVLRKTLQSTSDIPNIDPYAGGGPVVATGPNPGQQWFFGVTMSELGTLLSNLAGRPVSDKTGLKGRYDVSYEIELRPPPQADGAPAPVPPDFFSSQISTIVEDQLGLKLKA